MGTKIKIGMLIPSLQAGGMERVMSTLIWHFSKRMNVEVHLILFGKSREIFFSLPENINIHTPSFLFKNKLRIISTIKTIIFLRNTLKKIEPTASLSFGEYWNNLVLLSAFGLKIRIYVSDRSQPNKPLTYFHEKLRKWLYPNAAGVIAQTEKAKKIYSKLYKHKNIQVIANPINSNLINNVLNENIVLSVGRLINSKHHDELIRIFVRSYVPGWRLLILGDESLNQNNKPKLEKLIKELNAEHKVELLGKIKDVEKFYSKSKIFAFTSSSEGFPNVIGEAMSAGLPVIAYDCIAGPSEIIEHGNNGFLIPLFDEKQFAKKLKELMLNETLRKFMSENALLTSKKFTIDKICDEYFNFITLNNFKN